MSSWLRRRKTGPSVESRAALAMVLLPDSAAPDLPSLLTSPRANAPGSPGETDIEVQEAVAMAGIEGGRVTLVHVPAPIPAGDLEGPADAPPIRRGLRGGRALGLA